jgi:hypothetical protein
MRLINASFWALARDAIELNRRNGEVDFVIDPLLAWRHFFTAQGSSSARERAPPAAVA